MSLKLYEYETTHRIRKESSRQAEKWTSVSVSPCYVAMNAVILTTLVSVGPARIAGNSRFRYIA